MKEYRKATMLRDRYVIERGGVSHEERGYLRRSWCKLLGSPATEKFEWVSSYINATTYYDADIATKEYNRSGLYGGVLIKTDTEFASWKTCHTI